MPSNVPFFHSVRFKRMLDPDGEKGIQPHVVVTEEWNCTAVWRVTSAAEVVLLKHFRGLDARDAAITFAAKWGDDDG